MANLQSGMRITPQRSRGYQAGTVNISFSATSFASKTVTFSPAFAAAPIVVGTVQSGAGLTNGSTVRIIAVSASSVTIGLTLSAAQTTTVAVNWIAAEA